MKEYIEGLNEEKLAEAVRIKKTYEQGEIDLPMAQAQMKAHVGTLTPAELAYMEQTMQTLSDDECICEDLAAMLAIYEGTLVDSSAAELPAGHPIANYRAENAAVREVLAKLSRAMEKPFIRNVWEELFVDLEQFKVHLSRKQNQLYSALERKGFDRPTHTMWLFDNEIRDRISDLHHRMNFAPETEEFRRDFAEFQELILDLMNKEDTILYPTSLELLTEEEFVEMAKGDEEIGYCLITPQVWEQCLARYTDGGRATENSLLNDLQALLSKHGIANAGVGEEKLHVAEGQLTLEQINLLFRHLPVDISYVDENELVAFYSDTKHRVFPRSKGVIGRDVKNCHPKNSVAVVEEIIDKFRRGEEERAEFWIDKGDIFIYITYHAVRDEDGRFRGVLEMMQDCTRIRSLTGSRTLLTWESEKEAAHSVEDNLQADEEISLFPQMKLEELFRRYPGFKEYLVAKESTFQMLNSPLYKVMKKVATLEMAAERSGLGIKGFEDLLKEFLISQEEKNG